MEALEPSPAPRAPLRADAARNRRALLAAGREAFAEDGPEASIASIAKRAGCAKGTFFRHFASKDELITALLEELAGQLAAVADEVLGHPPGWAALCALIEGFNATIAPDRLVLRAADRGAGPPTARPGIVALDAKVQRILRAAQQAGEVRGDITETDIQLIAASITRATAPMHDDHPLLGRRLLRVMLDGVRADGATSDLGAPALTADELAAGKRAGHGPG